MKERNGDTHMYWSFFIRNAFFEFNIAAVTEFHVNKAGYTAIQSRTVGQEQ